MDELDRGILAALRADSRTPITSIAKKLGVARATVQHRINRLESTGAIASYTITSRPESGVTTIRAIMSIVLEGNDQQALIKELKTRPMVTSVYSTNGRLDMIAEIQATSLEEFDREINDIRQLQWVAHTETNILLSVFK